jgi:hypothetical protein
MGKLIYLKKNQINHNNIIDMPVKEIDKISKIELIYIVFCIAVLITASIILINIT